MFYGLLTNSIMSDLFQLLNGSLTLLSGQSCNYRVSFRNVVPGRFLLTKHQKSNGPDTWIIGLLRESCVSIATIVYCDVWFARNKENGRIHQLYAYQYLFIEVSRIVSPDNLHYTRLTYEPPKSMVRTIPSNGQPQMKCEGIPVGTVNLRRA